MSVPAYATVTVAPSLTDAPSVSVTVDPLTATLSTVALVPVRLNCPAGGRSAAASLNASSNVIASVRPVEGITAELGDGAVSVWLVSVTVNDATALPVASWKPPLDG